VSGGHDRMVSQAQRLDLAVVGGGVSGLALAFEARRRCVGTVAVLESDERPGGKIRTEWIDGFCCEWGPQGFLDNVPETLGLVRHLGLDSSLMRADDAAADRFILRDGRLRRVPLSPPAFLTSDVLSLPGRLRVLLEPFAARGHGDETVFDFARRRIGQEAAEVLVDAMVTGVYAGDPRRLSLPATFPRMREMESTYGSLTRAMLARRRAGSSGGPAGPGGTLTTFRRGMQRLTDALAERLGEDLRLGCGVRAVRRAEGGFELETQMGLLTCRRLVLAVPPGAAARLLAGFLPTPALDALREIPSVAVAVVMTGYRSERPFQSPTRGFGFLVPGRERRGILGTIFCDSTFPEEAPPGTTLLRTLVGGARDGEKASLPDADLLALVRNELDSCLGGDPEPGLIRIIRHERAIPQYTLGHLDRVAIVRTACERFPGLHVLGSAYGGIAVNSCIAEATRLAHVLAPAP
jgi:oxygen-dependent protoporphyrinogen oxidase